MTSIDGISAVQEIGGEALATENTAPLLPKNPGIMHWLRELLASPKFCGRPLKVLAVGANSIAMAQEFRESHPHLLLSGVCRDATQLPPAQAGANRFCGSIDRMPPPADEGYDLVFCAEPLGNLASPDNPGVSYARLAKMLEKQVHSEGVLVWLVPNGLSMAAQVQASSSEPSSWWQGAPGFDAFAPTPSQITTILPQAGLKVLAQLALWPDISHTLAVDGTDQAAGTPAFFALTQTWQPQSATFALATATDETAAFAPGWLIVASPQPSQWSCNPVYAPEITAVMNQSVAFTGPAQNPLEPAYDPDPPAKQTISPLLGADCLTCLATGNLTGFRALTAEFPEKEKSTALAEIAVIVSKTGRHPFGLGISAHDVLWRLEAETAAIEKVTDAPSEADDADRDHIRQQALTAAEKWFSPLQKYQPIVSAENAAHLARIDELETHLATLQHQFSWRAGRVRNLESVLQMVEGPLNQKLLYIAFTPVTRIIKSAQHKVVRRVASTKHKTRHRIASIEILRKATGKRPLDQVKADNAAREAEKSATPTPPEQK